MVNYKNEKFKWKSNSKIEIWKWVKTKERDREGNITGQWKTWIPWVRD